MLNFNIMDLGSYLRTNGKSNVAGDSPKAVAEGQASDFLMELLSKLIGITSQGLIENSEETNSVENQGKESKEGKNDNQTTQSADKTIMNMLMALLAVLFGKSDQLSESLAKETNPSTGLSFSELTSLLKELVLKGGVTKDEGLNSVLVNDLLSNMGLQLNQKTAQSPMDEAVIKAGETGQGMLSLMNTLMGIKNIEGKGAEKDLSKGLDLLSQDNAHENLKGGLSFRLAPDQKLVLEKEGIKNQNLIPNGENEKKGISSSQTIEIGLANNALGDSNKAEILSGNKINPFEYPQDGALDDLKGKLLFKLTPDQNLVLEKEGIKNQSLIPNGENERKGVSSPQTIEIGLANNALGDSNKVENLLGNKINLPEHLQRSFENLLSTDQTFSIKKQTPSSMEVVFEPDGLGKLDLQLNITNDRIHGQIMAHDTRGKELLENNLPQLLSELGKEGLQIGEFSVSLKNQGRDPNSSAVIPAEPQEEPKIIALNPEGVSPVQDNHLVHIII